MPNLGVWYCHYRWMWGLKCIRLGRAWCLICFYVAYSNVAPYFYRKGVSVRYVSEYVMLPLLMIHVTGLTERCATGKNLKVLE